MILSGFLLLKVVTGIGLLQLCSVGVNNMRGMSW